MDRPATADQNSTCRLFLKEILDMDFRIHCKILGHHGKSIDNNYCVFSYGYLALGYKLPGKSRAVIDFKTTFAKSPLSAYVLLVMAGFRPNIYVFQDKSKTKIT